MKKESYKGVEKVVLKPFRRLVSKSHLAEAVAETQGIE
jgi:hypothetical protein